MLTLAIDTATPQGRFALAEDGRLVAYQPHNVAGNYADALLPVVDEVLDGAGRRLDEVGLLATTVGPGSFTGVRIGVATAKALAYALDVPLVGVGTLAAMAADLLAEHPDHEIAVPALDARRGEIFAAAFRRDGAWVAPLAEPACLDPDAWWRRLAALEPRFERAVCGGDGVALLVGQGAELRPELRDRDLPVAWAWSAAQPATARALALAAADPELRKRLAVHPFALVPRYLRGSDAELARRIDATPREPSGEVDVHTGGRRHPGEAP